LSYLRNKIGVRGKVGVYGRSLGGIATTHLTKYVDMIFVDRSFGNLYEVAKTKFFGNVATLLYKFATSEINTKYGNYIEGWRARSDIDYLSTERNNKYGCRA
jgi:hypothetical protein